MTANVAVIDAAPFESGTGLSPSADLQLEVPYRANQCHLKNANSAMTRLISRILIKLWSVASKISYVIDEPEDQNSLPSFLNVFPLLTTPHEFPY